MWDHAVPDVPVDLFNFENWSVMHIGRLVFREPIHILEPLDLLRAVKHALRLSKVFGSGFLVLTDSMCVS